MEFLPLLFDTSGTLLIAYAALKVHHRILHDHQIDKAVYRTMHKEQILGIFGALLVVVSFFMHVL